MNSHIDNLSAEERLVAENAIKYVKDNKKNIIERFVGGEFSDSEHPISMFMAGSPGAGKTEVSKNLLELLGAGIARLDPDEIRSLLPGYTGSNSKIFQSAASIAIEKLHDYALK